MRTILSLTLIFSLLLASSVPAASIDNRLGLTGKLGFFVPMQDDLISGTSDSKTGLAAGGGLIFGLNENLAAELDITHMPSIDVEQAGAKVGDASLTDVSIGLQYRFTPERQLVPYLGAGLDFINGDFKNKFDQKYDFDWTFGGHVSAGVDYFATKGVALTAEMRGIFAAKGDIKNTGYEYDPTGFAGTVGIRLFLPERLQ